MFTWTFFAVMGLFGENQQEFSSLPRNIRIYLLLTGDAEEIAEKDWWRRSR